MSVSAAMPSCSLGDSLPPLSERAPAIYVLELNAGEAERLGLTRGDVLVFGPGIPSARFEP